MSSNGISRSPFGNFSSAITRRTSADVDKIEGLRLIELPYSPLIRNDHSDTDDFDDLFISPRDYGSRQAYLRSYTFTRAEPKAPEKIKKSLLRLKAAAWAAVACKYRLPLRARLLKERMLIKTSEYLSNGVHYLRPSCVQMPKCLMAGA
ncbi:uncharacterized protein [Physcomitrium patens]|uniref:Uncharacterized protein n=1 Tax=Physcomitrium patens TaxID=3218 RepID=A0A2K1KQ93_PHYPA|nr:uncharacterized protein LOC112281685 [Physcomitrium patens]PNR55939.1 hypothetical protein PHYPA_006836 [Physcomitrium patens]|eukprot:XP_024374255.1 uncharacterized protein LOC112281685 [Physcomitrella patens]